MTDVTLHHQTVTAHLNCQQSGSLENADRVMDIKVQLCFAEVNVCVYLWKCSSVRHISVPEAKSCHPYNLILYRAGKNVAHIITFLAYK